MSTPPPLTVALDARSLWERFTSNRTYWEGLVVGLAAIAEEENLQIWLMGNGEGSEETLPVRSPRLHVRISPKTQGRLWSLVTFPRMCHQVGADVAHMQYTVSPLFRCPTVTTIHDVSYFVHPDWFSTKDSLLLRITVRHAVKKARRVLAVSHHAKSEIARFLPISPDRIDVAHLAPQLGIAPVSAEAGDAVLARLGVERPYLLLVGGLSPRKNWRFAVDLLHDVLSQWRGLELVITGHNPGEAARVKDYAAKHGLQDAVITVGGVSVSDLSALYSRAHVLVHPSLYEGFGLTPLEAMACGTSVVVSDTASLPEVVNGCGQLIDGYDVDNWSSAVIKALEYEEVTDEQRLRHAAEFTWEKTARLTVESYRRAGDARR